MEGNLPRPREVNGTRGRMEGDVVRITKQMLVQPCRVCRTCGAIAGVSICVIETIKCANK